MPSKRSEEKKKAQATTADAPKVSRVGWKTGEQLEWMLTEWASFVRHQNEKTLDRFWPRVYHGWATRWPIIPSPESVAKHGSKENAILVIRMELRTVRQVGSSSHTYVTHPSSENSQLVSQPRPPGFQNWQVGLTAHSRRQTKACSGSILLFLRLEQGP
jgi:hypothetical protein